MSNLEPSSQVHTSSYLQNTITESLSSPLEAFSAVQQNFFDACREYTENVAWGEHWEVDHAALLLEFSVSETMQAIAASQKYAQDKLRLAHGFSIAEDTMRVELFRSLAPNATFMTYQENGAANSLDHSLRYHLREQSAETLLGKLISNTVYVIQKDVASFCEIVAMPIE